MIYFDDINEEPAESIEEQSIRFFEKYNPRVYKNKRGKVHYAKKITMVIRYDGPLQHVVAPCEAYQTVDFEDGWFGMSMTKHRLHVTCKKCRQIMGREGHERTYTVRGSICQRYGDLVVCH